ncbi:aminopeptidase N [Robiginitomaculum antarcticum]|uniref:aminopeptidase N n=1 Tax=Robiginitomaculum antarcticum TaxID=437507 RepID=UPI00036323DC|nr:aminopeptidase N [Robiginitomaculum antarcticum]
MRTDTAPTPTRLSDYAPFDFNIETVALDFNLDPAKTRVTSQMKMTRTGAAGAPLVLDGEDIDLISVAIDGTALNRSDYRLNQTQLIIKNVPDTFTLMIENTCAPKDNTQLMGLYVSGGRFFTQCEAEGFRRITYFPDRPDVLSTYRVTVTADKAAYPTLLSNGNLMEEGDLDGGRHFAVWEDPFRKPCYLFALVAGEFDTISDSFTTMSGRDIPLDIYVDPGDASRADYAMDSLKRSMAWDEKAFGREYDLDRFMIVAVRDFNFGAMENKGLNIFNSALLLADAKRATDMNFQRIESVVAHEYFHNWTGNRITCRDWFQLCLKEGFTVFRDQEFSAHERGAALQRIKDVKALRARQFPEDAGPLAHPVRPTQYLKIDNFYTATIYEKGAELIRMLKALLGEKLFRKGSDHYFETLDGTAATIEQFIECFEAASGRDLSQFMLWYEQAGTPVLSIRTKRDDSAQTLTVSLEQKTYPTPGQSRKVPMMMPVTMALIAPDGEVYAEQMIPLSTAKDTVTLRDIKPGSILSVNRGFAAPVTVNFDQTASRRAHIMAYETDLFSRWEAGQALARDLLIAQTTAIQSGKMPAVDPALRYYTDAIRKTLQDKTIDPGFKALALGIPMGSELLLAMDNVDPIAIAEAGDWLRRAIADNCQIELSRLYTENQSDSEYDPCAQHAARRALKNACLSLLATQGRHDTKATAKGQFDTADNMTDEISALMTLMRNDDAMGDAASDVFYERWKDDDLVVDKWFALQSSRAGKQSFAQIASLLDHAAYQSHNPNRVRALVGGFAMSNPKNFHAYDGSGYAFYTDRVIEMDGKNPGVAARLLGVFEIWKRLDSHRQTLIKHQLNRVIAGKPSKNVLEIAQKALGA